MFTFQPYDGAAAGAGFEYDGAGFEYDGAGAGAGLEYVLLGLDEPNHEPPDDELFPLPNDPPRDENPPLPPLPSVLLLTMTSTKIVINVFNFIFSR